MFKLLKEGLAHRVSDGKKAVFNENADKGFTLIELLIVIAIIAILAAAVILVLNPAQLLAQARDTTRISNLEEVSSAISLYVADVQSPSWTATSTETVTGLYTTSTPAVNNSTSAAGSGWVNIKFSSISSGSPISALPLDPVEGTCTSAISGGPSVCAYGYVSSSTIGTYKIMANLESSRYAALEATSSAIDTSSIGNGRNLFFVSGGQGGSAL